MEGPDTDTVQIRRCKKIITDIGGPKTYRSYGSGTLVAPRLELNNNKIGSITRGETNKAIETQW
jgi:hypothetical protein